MTSYVTDNLDQFYTSSNDVDAILSSINLSRYDKIVEPSAGDGAFSSKIQHVIAFDVDPHNGGIIKKDWFSVKPSDLGAYNHLLIIGNPPFGKRSMLAKQFIRHGIELGAESIVFILPNTFFKYSNQRMFDDSWRLVKTLPIIHDFHYENEPISIPCSCFIWTRNQKLLSNVNMRQQYITQQPQTFKFCNREDGDNAADFAVNGNNGKVKNINEITNPKAEHYIYVNDRNNVSNVRMMFERLHYAWVSSVRGGVSWINRNDIMNAWVQQYKNL